MNKDMQELLRLAGLAGGIKHISEEKADKDWDGDGKVESDEDEYKGVKDNAIKKAEAEGECSCGKADCKCDEKDDVDESMIAENPLLAMAGRAVLAAASNEEQTDEDLDIVGDNEAEFTMDNSDDLSGDDECHCDGSGDIDRMRSLAGLGIGPRHDDSQVEDGGVIVLQIDDGNVMPQDEMPQDEMHHEGMYEEEPEVSADEWEDDLAGSDHEDSPVDYDEEEFLGVEEPSPEYDLEPAQQADPSLAGVDPYELIQKIDHMQQSGFSSANATYDVSRLESMPIDRILNVYKKVMGEKVDEEDMNWSGDSGYQANSEGNGYDSGDTIAKDPYKGGIGFATGQATNAIDSSKIGNSGSLQKDNPISDVDEAVDIVLADLRESFATFCEEYEEVDEVFSSSYGGGSSSMRDRRGSGLGNPMGKKKTKTKLRAPTDSEGHVSEPKPEYRSNDEEELDEYGRSRIERRAKEFDAEREERRSQRKGDKGNVVAEPKPEYAKKPQKTAENVYEGVDKDIAAMLKKF